MTNYDDLHERLHPRYTVDHTVDEFGTDRYFVCDELNGNWVGDPYDSEDEALDEAMRLENDLG
jgi:hypothetical protein